MGYRALVSLFSYAKWGERARGCPKLLYFWALPKEPIGGPMKRLCLPTLLPAAGRTQESPQSPSPRECLKNAVDP